MEENMKTKRRWIAQGLSLLLLLLLTGTAFPAVYSQCPPDTDGIDTDGDGNVANDNVCYHFTGGDGFARMADGEVLYVFGFTDVTGVPDENVMETGMLAANVAGPTIKAREGQNVYLSLSNVGMLMRADLFDPHTVHFHGYPNASSVFDGEPMGSISINMGGTLTYFYNTPDPGTYLYHCHVEATEHMQMGMIGNLWVEPKQNIVGYEPNSVPPGKYVYNDQDGSTAYDVDFPIQITGFDGNFHKLHIAVQPLPFADMFDDYPLFNGRGYPDTVNPDPLSPPVWEGDEMAESQKVSSLITAAAGQKILLRLSNVETVDFTTVTVLGIPMRVVGKDAKQLRGPGGNYSYVTNSLTLGGGQSADVILDTAGVPAGTYFLYTSNLHKLSNGPEDFGGLMTEIVISGL
jgi:FtsP/CotA-like multicopper oxidase with cupredoxin domain